jgi:hypothetical protein
MATNRSGHRPGGGLHSKNVVQPNVRTGSGSKSTRPAGAAQIGNSWGDHSTNNPDSTGYRGEKLHGPAERNFQPVKFGNEIALNVKGGGPGRGRDVHASGSQGQHGSTNPGRPGLPSTKGQWPD